MQRMNRRGADFHLVALVLLDCCDLSLAHQLLLLVLQAHMRQRTSACVRKRQDASGCVRMRQNTSAYVRMRQDASGCVITSSYVCIRQHTSAYACHALHLLVLEARRVTIFVVLY